MRIYVGTVIDRFRRKRVVKLAQTTFIWTGAAMVYLTTRQLFAVSDFLLISVMVANGIGLSFMIMVGFGLVKPCRRHALCAP